MQLFFFLTPPSRGGPHTPFRARRLRPIRPKHKPFPKKGSTSPLRNRFDWEGESGCVKHAYWTGGKSLDDGQRGYRHLPLRDMQV